MHLGIDFGTSYTKLGCWKNGKLINLAGEGASVPTVVTYLPSTGNLYFGQTAWRLHEPGACHAPFFKLYLKRNLDFQLGPYHLQDILSQFFSYLNIQFVAPQDLQVDSVTIGVPNYFGLNARKLLIDTLISCFGIDKVYMLPEPAAAIMGYNLKNPLHSVHGDILSIDLGGGTSDFSFISLEPMGRQILLESQLQTGHDIFSGSEVDRIVLHHILFPAFTALTGISVNSNFIEEKLLTPRQNFTLNRMLKIAEDLKKDLGKNMASYLNIPDFYEGQSLFLNLDRDMFYTQIKPVLKRLEEYLNHFIKNKAASLGIYEQGQWNLDYLLLVGGASSTLGVKEVLASIFGNIPIIVPEDREFNVLTGLCTWEPQMLSVFNSSISTIYPFNFYIERYNPDQQIHILDKLPFDSSNLPLSFTDKYKIFTLGKDSVYNLSSDPVGIKFRIYEAGEAEECITIERFTNREVVLEVDTLKENLPEFTDIYLDLSNARLDLDILPDYLPQEPLPTTDARAALFDKQIILYEKYTQLKFAIPDLMNDYREHLKLIKNGPEGNYDDHLRSTFFKLLIIIQLLNNK